MVFQGARYGGCQFSFACDGCTVGRRVENAPPGAAPVGGRQRALEGFVMPEVGSATHFHVNGLSPSWRTKMMRVAQVGSFVFYRFGGLAPAAPRPSTPCLSSSPPAAEETVRRRPDRAETGLRQPLLAPVATAVAQGVAQGAADLVAAATSIGKPAIGAQPRTEARTELPKADTPLPAIGASPAAALSPRLSRRRPRRQDRDARPAA